MYAYDTEYIWDETLQKKRQVKKCIGKFNLDTGEIIPNGKRGRPVGSRHVSQDAQDPNARQTPVPPQPALTPAELSSAMEALTASREALALVKAQTVMLEKQLDRIEKLLKK